MHTNIRSRGYLCFMYFMQYACSHRPSEYSGCQHKYPPCITFLHTIEDLPASMYSIQMGPLYCRRPCRGPTKDYVRCIEDNAKVTKVKFPVVKAVRQICASGSKGNHKWATLLLQVMVTWLHYFCNTFLQWLINDHRPYRGSKHLNDCLVTL